jgi:pyruvate/2-oxoglutarate dehydrogenase complex dihydrolipoamide dehydrogenase (E3) component
MLTRLVEHDLVIIGGGVAGYVGAIKAGQEGMKVLSTRLTHDTEHNLIYI